MSERRIGYEVFARFYDQAMGEPTERLGILKNLIDKHNPTAESLLEVACGTGTILKAFEGKYELSGIDLSPEMLEKARAKVPNADLHQADMTNFHLGRSFDIVLCVFDSINHLPTFSQWEATFGNVDEQLNPNGVFIFDMNTRHKLDTMAAQAAFKQSLDGSEMELKVSKDKNDVYHWNIKVHEKTESGTVVHEEDILEVAFEKEKVIEGVKKYFDVVELVDSQQKEIREETNRIYFVCRKRA